MKVVVAILLLAAAASVHALPGGAPAAACPNIFPVGHTNPPNNITDVNQGPFALDISALASTDGMGYAYVPGMTYTLILSSAGEELFRGLLVQARVMADNSPTGSFSNFATNTEQSACTPPASAVTHSNRLDKLNATLTWTAPATETGNITFLYAVVVRYSPPPNGDNVNMFFATLQSPTIAEGAGGGASAITAFTGLLVALAALTTALF